MGNRRFLISCLVLLCLLAAPPVWAGVPPAPLVGRAAVVEGGLAVRPPAGAEWIDAGLNQPVAAGMSLRTAPQGRAVVRIGAAIVALAPATELLVGQLDASGIQIVLRQGRIGVQLSELDPARSIEVDIPRGGVWLLTPGRYDITAGDAQTPSRVAAYDGRARFVGKHADVAIAGGSASVLSGADPVVASRQDAASDDFVAWWRPAAADPDSQALHHVSSELTGYEALDGNGSWQDVDGYGAVWFPKSVADGWAPFRDGHWQWVMPWGWTWLADQPWGFATSHYGRWARIEGRWGWVPGKPTPHPGFMPAAVAFLGTAGIGLSYPGASGPAIGWFPLAPGEAYWPSYTKDLAGIRQLNAGSVGDAAAIAAGGNGDPPAAIENGRYKNRRFASVVPRAVFVGGKPVAASLVQLPQQRLEDAPLLAGSPQIAPGPAHAAASVVVAAAGRPAALDARLAHAVQTLDRILRTHEAAPARVAVLHGAHSRPIRLAQGGGHLRAPRRVHAGRRHLVAAVAHGGRPHLRLAAARRRLR